MGFMVRNLNIVRFLCRSMSGESVPAHQVPQMFLTRVSHPSYSVYGLDPNAIILVTGMLVDSNYQFNMDAVDCRPLLVNC